MAIEYDRIIDPRTAAVLLKALHRARDRRSGAPSALESYPRIAQRIVALWGYRECRDYLERLIMVDHTRGQRAGFPRAVEAELMFLYQLLVDRPEISRERQEPPEDPRRFAFAG